MRRLTPFALVSKLALAGLLLFTSALPACGPGAPDAPAEAPASVATPSLRVSVVDGAGGHVEDFEDRDRAEAVWLAIADGRAEARLYAEPGGSPASRYHLTVEATRPETPIPGDVAGAIARLAPDDAGFDASAFGGVRLALRGTPGTYVVQLGSARVDDHDHFNAYVRLRDDAPGGTPGDAGWTRFEVPFADFAQEGYGQPVAWTGRDLVHIAVYPLAGGAVTFGLDDVAFY